MNASSHIVVVDDEIQMRRLLRSLLEEGGYRVTLTENGAEALREAENHPPDLLILDLGLPDMDGQEVLRQLRQWSTFPVIIVSARSDEREIVTALDAGANDYLTKPFRSGELLARVRTALRSPFSVPDNDSVVKSGPLEIDLATHRVTRGGESVKLTPTEFSLLSLLIMNAGKVLTHSYILRQVWGPKYEGESQYTRVYIGQLRKKLETDPEKPELFLTESGVGYRFMPGPR